MDNGKYDQVYLHHPHAKSSGGSGGRGILVVGCFLLLRWSVLLCFNITPRYLTDVLPCSHTNVAFRKNPSRIENFSQ